MQSPLMVSEVYGSDRLCSLMFLEGMTDVLCTVHRAALLLLDCTAEKYCAESLTNGCKAIPSDS